MKQRPEKLVYPLTLAYCALLVVLAFFWDDPAQIGAGLGRILLSEDTLITDYVALGGAGAALINSALVLLVTLGAMKLSRAPVNGFTVAVLGLMAGFSLFGKDPVNGIPILCGSYLYARFRGEPFAKHVYTGLLATCIGPIVSAVAFSGGPIALLCGLLVGLLIGFILPPLTAYTSRFVSGMSLYGMGFSCGLAAMLIVAVLSSLGRAPESVLFWATGWNLQFGALLFALSGACLLAGSLLWGHPAESWRDFGRLLKASGRAPSDFWKEYGAGPVLLNVGLCGVICTGYILLIGGDLNGATVGGVLTVMGFAAYGKHPGNIIPVMAGLVLGGLTMTWCLTDPAVQIAGLFCTTLAPISGVFGWPAGILAGFLHSCLVLKTGGPVSGLNLYNNGFSGGLIAITLPPILRAVLKKEEE